jgi:hypothetical protein
MSLDCTRGGGILELCRFKMGRACRWQIVRPGTSVTFLPDTSVTLSPSSCGIYLVRRAGQVEGGRSAASTRDGVPSLRTRYVCCRAPATAPSQATSPEQLADSARCRKPRLGPLGLEVDEKLFRPPSRTPSASLSDEVDDLAFNGVWMEERRSEVLLQPGRPELLVSGEPLVTCLPSDPERVTQLCHRELATCAGRHEEQL